MTLSELIANLEDLRDTYGGEMAVYGPCGRSLYEPVLNVVEGPRGEDNLFIE